MKVIAIHFLFEFVLSIELANVTHSVRWFLAVIIQKVIYLFTFYSFLYLYNVFLLITFIKIRRKNPKQFFPTIVFSFNECPLTDLYFQLIDNWQLN